MKTLMIKIGPAVYSCAAIMTPPIICSLLDQIDSWQEPLLLLSAAIAWPVAAQFDNTLVANKIFDGLVFVEAVVLAQGTVPIFSPFNHFTSPLGDDGIRHKNMCLSNCT